MPRSIRLALAAILSVLLLPVPHTVHAAATVPGEVIVKYRAGLTPARRARTASLLREAVVAQSFPLIGAEHLRLSGVTTEDALTRLRSDAGVEYAEPNYVITADMVPNDTRFAECWSMRNTGLNGAFAGKDIKAWQAWDLFTGDPELKIGVIDTGIDYTHPDLAANIWTNPGEIPANGVDDDGNGYTDDLHGFDVLNWDGDPMDDGFHGTHVAGIIAAEGNNALGVAGVNHHARLVAIKFMTGTGVGDEAHAIAALQYAVAAGVRLTNNSWGNMPGGQGLLDAIDAAGAAGQLFVCAAGNSRWNIDLVPVYPACFTSPHMLTVVSTDGRDLFSSAFSNFGATSCQIGAPGSAVLSCQPGGLYQVLNGTSMASPHVTGVAALAMGYFPHASTATIRSLVLSSVDVIPALSGKCSTGGRLNAYKTLLNGDRTPPGTVANLAVVDSGASTVRLAWTATGDDTTSGTATSIDLRWAITPIDSASFGSATSALSRAPLAAGSSETLSVGDLPPGVPVFFAMRATDDFGNTSTLSNVVFVTLSDGVAGVDEAGTRGPALRITSANPGHGRMAFELAMSLPGAAELSVFDVRGARVRDIASGVLPAGRHVLTWDGRDAGARAVPPGLYLVQARTAQGIVRERIVMLR